MTSGEYKSVTLRNHKTLEELSFILRPFEPGDENGVIECVREEYGDSYYRREFYSKDRLLKSIDSGGLHLFIACCGDDICGIQTIISYEPEESRVEAASQIFRKRYRGFGLPFELVKYTYEYAETLHPSCIYASCVVFHRITQQMCEDVGMIPVAFNLGSHLTSAMSNSFYLGDSEKYAQAILIKPVDKKEVGNIFIHPDITDTVDMLYSRLGVKYDMICRVSGNDAKPDKELTALDIKVNDREQSVCIYTEDIGRDFYDAVSSVRSGYSGEHWTIQLILPVDKPVSIWAYETLRRDRFFFTGIRPLCSAREQIIMQQTGDVYFNFDDFVLTESFTELLEHVKGYYRER